MFCAYSFKVKFVAYTKAFYQFTATMIFLANATVCIANGQQIEYLSGLYTSIVIKF